MGAGRVNIDICVPSRERVNLKLWDDNRPCGDLVSE